MMIFLREKFIAQIMMIIIGIMFLIGAVLLGNQKWGGSSGGGREDDVVLKISGTEVKRSEFERLVSNEIQRQQQQTQGRSSVDRKQVEKDVIDRLVQQQILLTNAQISNAEIERYIRSDSNQVTTYNIYYRQGLGDFYRKDVRLRMSYEALQNDIQGLELITDVEVEKEYRRQNNKAKFKYIQFQHFEYNNAVKVEDAEVQAYFEKNKEKYRIADQINLKFIKIDPKNFVSDDMVQAYYDSHKQEFTTPEAVKARHILKKFPDNATDEQKGEVKTEAEELLKKVQAEIAEGKDFADLAKEHSDDTGSASQGGALRGRHPKLPPGDYFARGDMVPPFEKTCFDELKPGEVSGLVETQFGYHIIKLEEKKPEDIQLFDFAKREIKNKLIQIDGVDEAKTIAEELLFDVEIYDYEEAIKLDQYKDLSLTLQDTGLFPEDDSSIPKIGSKYTYRGLIERVFDMEVNVSDVIDAKKTSGDIEAYFVGKVSEKKRAAIPEFEAVKDKVTNDFRKEKYKQLALEDAKNLFSLRSNDESLEELAKKYEPPEGVSKKEREVKESNLFPLSPLSNFIPNMGNSREAMLAAFNMELNEVGGPFQGDNASYIVQLVEQQEPDIEKFESDPAEKSGLRRSLLRSKKSEVYANWIAALEKQTPKWIHPDYQ